MSKRAHSQDAASLAYLARIGARLRQMRARRGMTQKLLAARSGVSQRHIALLEAGTGNISVLLLRRIAAALATDLGQLAADAPERAPELVMLEQTLARVPPAELSEARALLLRRFAPPASLRQRRIALVGLRGAGKSALGARLAARRGVRFVELDREIEHAGHLELRELFELRGQEGFRALEHQVLQAVLATQEPLVIATGGSLVTEPRTYELLLAGCVTVWLRATPEEHMQRVLAQGDVRPLANDGTDMDHLRAILASRAALYGQADLQLDTSGQSLDGSLDALAAMLPDLRR